ncbi:MAG: ATP-binding protein [Polyangiaceae bacterium]
MRDLVREFDWSATPLGPIEGWSPALRSASDIVLANGFPQVLWWGAELVQIYNDSMVPVLGARHPARSLGRTLRECWPEAGARVGPLIEEPLRKGRPSYEPDLRLAMERAGHLEDLHFMVACSPVPDPSAPGGVGGVLGMVLETTERRRTEMLLVEHRRLLEPIAKGKPLDDCLSSACSAIRRMSAGTRACVLLADAARATFERAVSPHLAASFRGAVRGAAIEELAIGTCGVAVFRNEPVRSVDIENDERWAPGWRSLCLTHGVRACHSEPIQGIGGRAIGSFLVCFETAREPTDWELQLAQFGADVAAIALEADRATSALRETADQLREADRRKDELLATLAHELRNPLAPIRNCLAVVARAGQDAVKRERALAVMDRQVAQMVRLIDDLLDVNRIRRGTFSLHKAPVEVREMVQSAVESTSPLMEAAEHRLTVTLPEAPVLIDADGARMSQVIANLLSNAAKFTPPGGEVQLSAKVTEGELIVSVADNGVGIAPERLESVFEMFTQLDSGLERAPQGLGLGLHLARRLVEMHGGVIQATSAGRGTGTEVVLRLPAVTGASQGMGPAVSGGEGAGPRLRVLIVDDNEDAAVSLAELLELLGHDARTAESGPAALALGPAFRPEVVLLDIGMPAMSGYEVCQRLRKEAWGRGALVAALTGWGQAADRQRSREAGFDAHLVKPADLKAVEALLAKAEGRRGASEGG